MFIVSWLARKNLSCSYDFRPSNCPTNICYLTSSSPLNLIYYIHRRPMSVEKI